MAVVKRSERGAGDNREARRILLTLCRDFSNSESL